MRADNQFEDVLEKLNIMSIKQTATQAVLDKICNVVQSVKDDSKTSKKIQLLLLKQNFPNMSNKEISKVLNVSNRTLYRWLSEAE